MVFVRLSKSEESSRDNDKFYASSSLQTVWKRTKEAEQRKKDLSKCCVLPNRIQIHLPILKQCIFFTDSGFSVYVYIKLKAINRLDGLAVEYYIR